MELTLHHNSISCYQLIHHRTHSGEETQEAIVPDACPDIMRVIDTYGRAYLRGKQARDGTASVTGVVISTVLYQPEGESGLRKVEVTIPFERQISVPALTSQGELVVTVQMAGLDARILNPRKLLIRADISIGLQAFMPQQVEVCHNITALETVGIQQRQESHDIYPVLAIQSKAFTFSEQVRPAGQGELGEVMICRGLPRCTECKRIGNKLIFKGEVALQLLVREPAGGLSVSEHPLPFSQIMEVAGGDSEDIQLYFELVQLEILPGDQGEKQLEVQIELVAQAVVRGQCALNILTDIYSTSWMMESERVEHSLERLFEQSSSTQNVRELLEMDGAVRKVVDCWCSMDEVTQKEEGGRLLLSTAARIGLLYLDENGSLQSAQHLLPVSAGVDIVSGRCHCRCRCPQEIYATPAAGGVEVRLAVQFDYLSLEKTVLSSISAASITLPRSRGEDCPSVVLRRGESGETLWDLAKCYGTTCREIVLANELDEDAPLPEGMLLIPSVR